MTAAAYLSLTEFVSTRLERDRLSSGDIAYLQSRFSQQIWLTETVRMGAGQVVLIPQGVIGQIRLPSGRRLLIQPKVPIAQLFGMISYVYQLKSIEIGGEEGSLGAHPYDQLFEHFANRLLDQLEQLLKRGLFQSFKDERSVSKVVRGRIDPSWLAKHPFSAEVMSEQSDLTIDNPYNQVLRTTLSWMLKRAALSKTLRARVTYLIPLLPTAELLDPLDVIDQLDYAPQHHPYQRIHTLCRFLLAGLMPDHRDGAHTYPSFLLETAPLFERFVAKWLGETLGPQFRVQVQKRKRLDASPARYIAPDMLIYTHDSDRPLAVLDTKYKQGNRPALNDIYQVTFYAAEFGVKQAGLIYPHAILEPLIGQNREVAYRTISFDLSQPIDAAGELFRKEIDELIRVFRNSGG